MLCQIVYGLAMTQIQPHIFHIWAIYSAVMLVVTALWSRWALRVALPARRSE